MSDPILARRDRRTQPKGGELGLPNNCQLGKLDSRGWCSETFYKRIGRVRLCKKHHDLVTAIAKDARAEQHGRRKPQSKPVLRSAA